MQWVREGRMDFSPQQPEDYCFARAFGHITAEDGKNRWPSLKGHESDRISEMEQALQETEINSRDHRVVQAIAMRKKNKVKVRYPDSVNKSWPQFWRFLQHSKNL